MAAAVEGDLNRCSFCGACGDDDGRVIVVGPRVTICECCVDIARDEVGYARVDPTSITGQLARAEVERLKQDSNAIAEISRADADAANALQRDNELLRGALLDCYEELALHTDSRTADAELALARAFVVLWPDAEPPPSVRAALGREG